MTDVQGHEDLRQDERVMQLFGLVNSMLANDRTTAERDLSIARYAVIPLSPNSGLIGWVPNTDTLHALIRWGSFGGNKSAFHTSILQSV